MRDHGLLVASRSSVWQGVSAQPAVSRFLCRFGSLHAQPPLGVFFPDGAAFYPALPPNPSAPAARALDSRARMARSLLPRRPLPPRPRRAVRLHGLHRAPRRNPVFRRYILLPPIPVENPYLQHDGDEGLQSGRSEDEGLQSQWLLPFTVIWMACCRGKLVAFYFCS